MKKIALIHQGGAHKPEIIIYKNYFTSHGISVDTFKSYPSGIISKYDIEWHFLGFDFHSKQARIKIHEYSSVSNPPLSLLKRMAKKWFNVKPDLRIFGSDFVADAYDFSDQVPHRFREAAGIGEFFYNYQPKSNPNFDYVYCGTMEKVRQIDQLLAAFVQNFPHSRNLLMVGEPTLPLYRRYRSFSNIIFTGKVPYEEIPGLLGQAKYGINFIPDIYPLNKQVPLKLLEYCALGLKVITTDYPWIRNFADERNAQFFFLSPDLKNWNERSISNHQFVTPQVGDLSWEKVMDRSRLLSTILNFFA